MQGDDSVYQRNGKRKHIVSVFEDFELCPSALDYPFWELVRCVGSEELAVSRTAIHGLVNA